MEQVGNLNSRAVSGLVLMARNAHAAFYAKVENRYAFQMWHFEKYGKYYDFHTAEEIDYLPEEDIPNEIAAAGASKTGEIEKDG